MQATNWGTHRPQKTSWHRRGGGFGFMALVDFFWQQLLIFLLTPPHWHSKPKRRRARGTPWLFFLARECRCLTVLGLRLGLSHWSSVFLLLSFSYLFFSLGASLPQPMGNRVARDAGWAETDLSAISQQLLSNLKGSTRSRPLQLPATQDDKPQPPQCSLYVSNCIQPCQGGPPAAPRTGAPI